MAINFGEGQEQHDILNGLVEVQEDQIEKALKQVKEDAVRRWNVNGKS